MGYILTEGGGDLLDEAGSPLLDEAGAPGSTVALTTPNVALAAPLLTPSASSTVALTTPNMALAAPVVAPAAGKVVALTTPNIALTAPLLAPSGGSTVTLTTPNLALSAPLLAPVTSSAVALTTPNLVLNAPPVTPPAPAFPQSPLDLRCELYLGNQWVDVSSYVYQRDGSQPPVSITRGRPDETQQAVPSRAAWQWNNRDGRFSPKNPLSPFYGQLMRNTPVRFSVPAQQNYLRLEAGNSDQAYAADNATLHVTGSLEVRIGLRLSDWRGCALAVRNDSSLTGSWGLILRGDGTLRWFWYDSSNVEHQAVSDAPLPYTSGDFAVRVLLDATVGTVAFYTSPTIDGTYTLLGDAFAVTGGAATSVRAGSDPLRCGWSPGNFSDIGNGASVQMYGRVYEVRLYNGIGGSIAAAGVFSAQAAGTTAWTDSAGNAWSTAGGAEISSRDYRYHGLMSSMPPRWDVTGNDMYVPAQAGAPLRIMSQGSAPPVMSPMKRAILAQSGAFAPVAYWPLEDAAGATRFGPAIGPNPVTWNGAPVLATSSVFACSAPLPAMGNAALNGVVPSYTGTGSWAVRFLADIPTLPGAEQEVFQVDCLNGLAAYVGFFIDPSGFVQLTAYDNALNVVADTGLIVWPGGVSQPLWWSIEAQPASGGKVQYSVVSLPPGASLGLATSVTSSAAGSAGTVATVGPAAEGGWSDLVIGHVQVQSAIVSLFSLFGPLDAWNGEAAGNRFVRLAAENGWPVRAKGSPALSAPMGQQGAATLPALLQECETADLGQLLEPRETAGLGYRTLASMLAQSPRLTLDYSASQPGGTTGGGDSGLDPTYDDLLARNDWTVTRGAAAGSQGASVRAALSDGSTMSTGVLADYADTATVNVELDSQLGDVAGWKLHLGTVDEHRWPAIPVNLARTEMAALQSAAMTVDAGDMVTVTSLPDQVLLDPARELALGFTEQLGGKHWTMTYQAVPESPYEVIILDDPVYGRLDTDGSTVHTTATYPQSSLTVDTTGTAPLWSTAAGDDPFDIAVSGMRLTVTAVSGSSSPQTLTVTPAVNGVQKTLTAGSDVRLWFPPILSLI